MTANDQESPFDSEDAELYELYRFFVSDVRRILESTGVTESRKAAYEETFAPMPADEFSCRIGRLKERPDDYRAYVSKLKNGAYSAISPRRISEMEEKLDQLTR